MKQAFVAIDVSIFSSALKIFRNTRTFFEQNEREKMKDKVLRNITTISKKLFS